jgi:dihydrodipicolinate synthase/N-acetylneuraminate lyase
MELPYKVSEELNKGVVIPALPLALNRLAKLDERRQRALIRYYLDAGAGGIAAGVHTTQFEIREPSVGLYSPLLAIVREEFDKFDMESGKQTIRIAGIAGKTPQAISEAEKSAAYGYHAGLLSLAAFRDSTNKEILQHCRTIAGIIPLFGFYLQPAVGGRKLDTDFWRGFAAIENVVAIKIAPFNRYQTLDVIRGVAESGRADNIALYTGNDDNILADLLTEYQVRVGNEIIRKRIVGGLLGHWAVWTRTAVNLLEDLQKGKFDNDTVEALSLAAKITDCNSAFFDAANNFRGCIVGLHEVLRRQGFLEGVWTLNPDDILTPGQKHEIDRVYAAYPELNDDEFVKENIGRWMEF